MLSKKNKFCENFEKCSKSCHFTVKVCQITKFCKIIELWKNFEYLPSPFKHQSHKMVKHNQTIRRQIVDELFECA